MSKNDDVLVMAASGRPSIYKFAAIKKGRSVDYSVGNITEALRLKSAAKSFARYWGWSFRFEDAEEGKVLRVKRIS